MNDTENSAAAILAAGSAIGAQINAINPTDIPAGGAPLIVVPEGYELRNLEDLLPAPSRKKGTTVLNDENSFVHVVNDQKNASTRLFSALNPPSFTAVFNADADGPGWGDHRAAYALPLSPEWKTWAGRDSRQSKQAEFAQFIEGNLPDIIEPVGATVLEVVRTLEAKKKVSFASGIRLSNGEQQLIYEEEIQGSAQKGTLTVPEIFVLAIPVFENGEPWRVEARLRYRIGDDKSLTLWYELVRPHKIIEAAVNEVRARVAEKTALPLLNGSPA